MNYTPKDLKTQYDILSEAFKEVKEDVALHNLANTPPGLLPEGAEHWFLIPDWSKLAPTYPEAVARVWETLKSSRGDKAYSYVTIDTAHLRQRTKLASEVVAAQFGKMHKGRSVNDVRNGDYSKTNTAPFLLGSYEVLIMLITHPDRLIQKDGAWEGIDCPNDDYAPDGGGRFSKSLFLYVYGGEFKFYWGHLVAASDYFGSAFGFVPQTLDPRPLAPIDSLSLESAMKKVKEAGFKIVKEY